MAPKHTYRINTHQCRSLSIKFSISNENHLVLVTNSKRVKDVVYNVAFLISLCTAERTAYKVEMFRKIEEI